MESSDQSPGVSITTFLQDLTRATRMGAIVWSPRGNIGAMCSVSTVTLGGKVIAVGSNNGWVLQIDGREVACDPMDARYATAPWETREALRVLALEICDKTEGAWGGSLTVAYEALHGILVKAGSQGSGED